MDFLVCFLTDYWVFIFLAIRRRELGWNDTDHPLVFLFLGSSGIGIHVYPTLSSNIPLFVFSLCLLLSFPVSPSLLLCSSLSLSFSVSPFFPPTLLGKTELAKQVAQYLHKNNPKVYTFMHIIILFMCSRSFYFLGIH